MRYSFALLLAGFLSLSACTKVRQTTPLAYAGQDGRSTVASLESSIKKRGYKPICEEREFCKFQMGSSVWIHYKTSEKKVVMAIDVVGGTEMPADKRKALTDEASKVGEEIWGEASADAQQREKAEVELAKAEAAKKKAEKAEEERRAAEQKKAEAATASNGSSNGSGGGVAGFLNAATSALGGVAKAQENTSATCCVNGAYYHCKTPSAVNKCAGEFSVCVTKCVMGSDMSCADRCLKDHPPDPSGCDRMPDRDGECANKR